MLKNLFSKLKSKTTLAAGVFTVAAASSHAAGELVTVTDGTTTFNPDSLVEPIRGALTSSITSASTIFVIIAGVVFVIMMIKKFRRG